MPFLHDDVLDDGLQQITDNGNRLYICSQEPTTYTDASSTYALGNKASLSVAAPSNRSPSGREVVVSAITDGSVTATGTATHLAVVDTVNSKLLATQALAASQAVTNGNTFTLTQFAIGIPDPA